jgi:hypothetical protein
MISINRENERLYYVVRQGVEMAEKAGSYKVGNVYFIGGPRKLRGTYSPPPEYVPKQPINILRMRTGRKTVR